MLFNIFLNDIFYFIRQNSLYNSTDDNTLSNSYSDLSQIRLLFEAEGWNIIDWFDLNDMQANPGKFVAIFLGERGHGDCKIFIHIT